MMLRYLLIFALVIAAAAASAAEKTEIRPGQYVLDGDRGTLSIRKGGAQNKLTFEIGSVGQNCHSCSVSGVISGATGHGDSWAGDGSDSKCDISFSANGTDVMVRPMTQDACRAYCGMRAGFDGTYRIPPVACASAGRKKLRDRFLGLYSARQFVQAGETLQTLIAQCKSFMGWIEIDQVRNDLALAQYRSGESQLCLKTLSDTLAARVRDEQELKSGSGGVNLPPCDFESYIGVAKATWFNKALCTKASSKGQ